MVLYERIDLELPILSTKPPIPACRLEKGLGHKGNDIFVHHGAGIHRVNFPWTEMFQEHLFPSEGVATNTPLPSLPPSQVTWLLNTLPLGDQSDGPYIPFTGFTLVSGLNLPPTAVAVDSYKVLF